MSADRTDRLVIAVQQYLERAHVTGDLDMESYVNAIKETVPDVTEEEAVTVLQAFMTFGEGEDFGEGEEDGFDFGGAPFVFDTQ